MARKAHSVADGTQYAIRATWYCGNGSRCTVGYPAGGYFIGDQWIGYAAISPDLRSWSGRLVVVRYGSASVLVRIIDCLCSREHGIDLYARPFAMLAPLSAGVITVTLELR